MEGEYLCILLQYITALAFYYIGTALIPREAIASFFEILTISVLFLIIGTRICWFDASCWKKIWERSPLKTSAIGPVSRK